MMNSNRGKYINRNRNRGRRGGRRPTNRTQHLPMSAPSAQGPRNNVTNPSTYPRICVARTAEGLFDVNNDGINPSLLAFNFSLNDLPGYTEMTAMFQSYCIEQVEIWFRPEYTVLSDASALSSAINVEFNSAIDLVDGTAPPTVDALLEYQTLAHTSITTTHYRKIRPAYLLDGISPSCTQISCASPATNWFGLKVAIKPCGTAMVFRSTVKYKVALIGLK
jgi:hypothetical protein